MDRCIFFSNSFLEVTSKLHDTGKHSDVRITLDDGSSYNLHKAILSTHSPLLRKMFYYNPGKTEYHLGVVTKRGFECVLSYIYKDEDDYYYIFNRKMCLIMHVQ